LRAKREQIEVIGALLHCNGAHNEWDVARDPHTYERLDRSKRVTRGAAPGQAGNSPQKRHW
jgi:hypothetical protein